MIFRILLSRPEFRHYSIVIIIMKCFSVCDALTVPAIRYPVTSAPGSPSGALFVVVITAGDRRRPAAAVVALSLQPGSITFVLLAVASGLTPVAGKLGDRVKSPFLFSLRPGRLSSAGGALPILQSTHSIDTGLKILYYSQTLIRRV